jgi:hypothetical protein
MSEQTQRPISEPVAAFFADLRKKNAPVETTNPEHAESDRLENLRREDKKLILAVGERVVADFGLGLPAIYGSDDLNFSELKLEPGVFGLVLANADPHSQARCILCVEKTPEPQHYAVSVRIIDNDRLLRVNNLDLSGIYSPPQTQDPSDANLSATHATHAPGLSVDELQFEVKRLFVGRKSFVHCAEVDPFAVQKRIASFLQQKPEQEATGIVKAQETNSETYAREMGILTTVPEFKKMMELSY